MGLDRQIYSTKISYPNLNSLSLLKLNMHTNLKYLFMIGVRIQ
jgi:hypothetical protein